MLLTREQARSLDRRAMDEFAVPGIVLMENAGRGMAELLRSLGISGRVVICCGKGNNGGDGFVIARHLDNARIDVRVLLFGAAEELAGDAAINHTILVRSGVSLKSLPGKELDEQSLRDDLANAEWIVDALFGSGLQGPVRPPFDKVIAAINSSGAKVFAVDIPSGLDSDTGVPMGPTVRARHTATVVAAKVGFTAPLAREWLGEVHTIDMGAPRRLIEEPLAATTSPG
jgi:NAD(P)H-hydrate epimerase